MELIKIAVIGPESTGKSTLCERLAKHYKSMWCPEFAREYLQTHGTKYNYDDLLTIAKGQISLEEEYINTIKKQSPVNKNKSPNHSPMLFIDTEMYVMKVWNEFVFGKCHRFILDQIVQRKYDLFLLCNVDLPWIKDDLREYPDIETRKKIYCIYKDIMIHQPVLWIDVSGEYDVRLKKAIDATEQIILHH